MPRVAHLIQFVGVLVHTIGASVNLRVDASSEEDIRVHAIQIRRTHEILARAMTIGITPIGCVSTRQRIGNDIVGISIPTIDIHEPFLS